MIHLASPTKVKLLRMQQMFAAYQEILSPQGQGVRRQVNSLVDQLQQGNSKPEFAAQVAETATLMPDPAEILTNIAWQTWFNPQVEKTDNHMTEGCNEPCQHCAEGLGKFRSRNSPLPIAEKKAARHNLKTGSGGDILHWHDPFFQASIDIPLKMYVLAGELKQGYPYKDGYRIETIITRGWGLEEQRVQQAAVRLAQNSHVDIEFSFHLALAKPDIISALYRSGAHIIPDRIVEEYAQRQANVIRTLAGNINTIRLYDSCYFYDNSFNSEDFAFFNQATRQVFYRTMDKLGIPRNLLEAPLATNYSPRERDKEPRVRHGDYNFGIELSTLAGLGRGGDFFSRLSAAQKGQKGCFRVDRSQILDETLYPHGGWCYPEGGISGRYKYPQIEISRGGKVVVRSVNDPQNILVRSTLDELYPVQA